MPTEQVDQLIQTVAAVVAVVSGAVVWLRRATVIGVNWLDIAGVAAIIVSLAIVAFFKTTIS